MIKRANPVCENCIFHGPKTMLCFNYDNKGKKILNPKKDTCEWFDPKIIDKNNNINGNK